jgi:enoyl-CoA hydratase
VTPGEPAPEEGVRVERRGAVAVVTLNRPSARNAVDVASAVAVGAAFDDIESADEIRVAILAAEAGSTGVFCAGADLGDIAAGRAPQLMGPNGFAGFTHRARQVPVIAAVDGLALGGGCELVLACDLIVASPRSAFGLPEVRRNLLASGGGVVRLPRALGTRIAMEAVLTGEPVTAERAYQLGMVNRLVASEDVLDAALTIAAAIASGAPAASRAARRIVQDTWDRDEGSLHAEAAEASVRLRTMADTQEGVQAFLERRAPTWAGR